MNLRTRNWTTVVYPESAPENWELIQIFTTTYMWQLYLVSFMLLFKYAI